MMPMSSPGWFNDLPEPMTEAECCGAFPDSRSAARTWPFSTASTMPPEGPVSKKRFSSSR